MNMNTNTEILAIAAGVGILIVIFAAGFIKRKTRSKLNVASFQKRWVELQRLCGNTETWPLAIINADKLLDDALRQRKYKGKTMGERLVAAQHDITNNDGVWFGHKMRNKLVHEETPDLKKQEVLNILTSFRQALKDLGALK